MPRPTPAQQPTRPALTRVSGTASPTPSDTAQRIIESITTAIIERQLMPGTKLAEQKIAVIFQVSRTIVRQALHQLSRDKLITLQKARGARCAAERRGGATGIRGAAHARDVDDPPRRL